MKSKLPEGWKQIKLEDISKENSGMYGINESAVEYSDDLYRYLRITDITDDGKIDETKKVSVNISINKDSKYVLQKNDIVLARTGASVGRNYFYTGKEDDMIFAGFLIKFALDESKALPEYIKYYCQSRDYKQWINSVSTGTSRPNINATMYKNMELKLPPYKQQKLLVDTLSSLDNKIELNNKINENLEQQAQAIFKHWFVDFEFPDEDGKPYKSSGGQMIDSELGMIPKGWEVVELNEVAELTMGLSPKSSTYNFDYIGMPLLNGASDFKDGLIEATKYTSTPTRTCKKDDIVFCIRATIGNITFADKEYCIGRGVASITPNTKVFKGLIYYNLQKSIERLTMNASGSVILGLSKPDINNLKFVISDNKILNTFSNTSNSIFKLKSIKEDENQALLQLRDTLLPKLMSGEIRIPLD